MPKGVYRRKSLAERLWARVDRRGPDECWPWVGRKRPDGYGQLQLGARKILAHRAAYELLVGPIPVGLTLDHLCRNRPCVNPAHLEPVSDRENILRGEGTGAQYARRTRCPAGHVFDTTRTDGGRRCGRCSAEADRVRYQKNRTARVLYARAHRKAHREEINARRRVGRANTTT